VLWFLCDPFGTRFQCTWYVYRSHLFASLYICVWFLRLVTVHRTHLCLLLAALTLFPLSAACYTGGVASRPLLCSCSAMHDRRDRQTGLAWPVTALLCSFHLAQQFTTKRISVVCIGCSGGAGTCICCLKPQDSCVQLTLCTLFMPTGSSVLSLASALGLGVVSGRMVGVCTFDDWQVALVGWFVGVAAGMRRSGIRSVLQQSLYRVGSCTAAGGMVGVCMSVCASQLRAVIPATLKLPCAQLYMAVAAAESRIISNAAVVHMHTQCLIAGVFDVWVAAAVRRMLCSRWLDWIPFG
jgi:hypothetical protein